MKTLVKLKWVEESQKWHMLSLNDSLIYDFFNCDNFKKIFNNPRQDKDEIFLVETTRFGEDKEHIITGN